MKKLRNLMSLLICFLVINAAPVQAATTNKTLLTDTDLLLIILLVSVTVNILFIKIFVAVNHNVSKKEKKSTQTSLENNDLKVSINQLNRQIQILESWKKNVIKAVPNIDELINDEIAKDNAKNFENTLSRVLKTKPSTKNYYVFKNAIENYNSLSENVRKHVSTDIALVEEKLQIAQKCYIHAATQYFNKVNHCHPTSAEHLKWEQALNYYNSLPSEIYAELDRKMINEFLSMYQMAMADHNYSKLSADNQ